MSSHTALLLFIILAKVDYFTFFSIKGRRRKEVKGANFLYYLLKRDPEAKWSTAPCRPTGTTSFIGSSHRPISLLSSKAKTLEKIILDTITPHLPNIEHQLGFKQHHSTIRSDFNAKHLDWYNPQDSRGGDQQPTRPALHLKQYTYSHSHTASGPIQTHLP